jgi:hypothetical protein
MRYSRDRDVLRIETYEDCYEESPREPQKWSQEGERKWGYEGG